MGLEMVEKQVGLWFSREHAGLSVLSHEGGGPSDCGRGFHCMESGNGIPCIRGDRSHTVSLFFSIFYDISNELRSTDFP